MKRFKTLLGILIFLILFQTVAQAKNVWINDLKDVYISGKAIIYGINIRTFAAKDLNNDGIINTAQKEEKGNFLNAINRLDEISTYGINTIDILPILPVGKTNALGTAGSLYAPVDFSKINPQLKAPKSQLSIEEEMMMFVNECHNRKIRVMVTLPAGAAYDLYLKKPNIFLRDDSQNPIATDKQSDAYFLDGGSETNINTEVFKMYSVFVQKMMSLGVDGVKITSPETKPNAFWKKLISETHITEPHFLFLADCQIANADVNINKTSKEELLNAGFDGYISDMDPLWTNPESILGNIKKDINLTKKYTNKRITANFATQKQTSPVLVKGLSLSNFIIWLQATLPVNSYFVDGFATGDDYLYQAANRFAKNTDTDSSIYYVEKGKLDIYNFSRKPEGEYTTLKTTFTRGNQTKNGILKYTDNTIKFEPYRTTNPNIIAFSRELDKITIVFIGNTNFDKESNVTIKLKPYNSVLPITANNLPTFKNNTLEATLSPGEVCVLLLINNLETK